MPTRHAWGDIQIIFGTVWAVLRRDGINLVTTATMEEFKGAKEKLRLKQEYFVFAADDDEAVANKARKEST